MSDRKERLLRIKAEKNRKRPKFLRSEWHRLKRLRTSWRRPKGIDNKMRHKLKGKRKMPMTGYKNPKEVRGLHPSGFEIVRIFNVGDLEKVNPETQVAQIASTVGTKKRLAIIELAEEMEIHIINPQLRRKEHIIEEEEEVYTEEDFALLDEEEEEDVDLSEAMDDEDEEETEE